MQGWDCKYCGNRVETRMKSVRYPFRFRSTIYRVYTCKNCNRKVKERIR